MRVLGWVLAAVLVLPFVKTAVQLAVVAAIGLALLFALRNPQEVLGCTTMFALIGLGHQYPVAATVLFCGLVFIAFMAR